MDESENGPLEQESGDVDWIALAAQAAKDRMPDNYGFIVFGVELNSKGQSTVRYCSSLNREQAIQVLKAWLIKCSGAEDWMKHID